MKEKIKKRKVLIFPGGTEIGLEIWRSLRFSKEIELFSAGSNISNHALYVFKRHFIVPDVSTKNWLTVLNAIITKNRINYIFPAHDEVLLKLVKNEQKIKAKIISSPLRTCIIARSKKKTYKIFQNLMPIPKIYSKISEINQFPVFVKPDKGQGAYQAQRVDNIATLKILREENPDFIVIEYLPGKEYTVDCFSDRKRGLLFCGGRERIRIKSGISMNSKPVENNVFQNYAQIISKKLEFHGAWFFQLKEDLKGILKLLEIAPRIGGTMATHRVLGINFPLLSIYEAERIPIEIILNQNKVEIDRALANRYRHKILYKKIYVDLDDTLILNGNINTQLISFLYQCINKNLKIILLSKCKKLVLKVLQKFRLQNLFDKVIILKKNQHKGDYIDPKEAIFIDDSFSERRAVFKRYGIPTFDCSMIEILIDEKV